ncbi:MAG: enoyl-CoA hydratase-related protein [Bdellovibrionia bacterium]
MLVATEKIKNWVRVTLSRPDVHNAFNGEMIRELTETFNKITADRTVRGVVLSGAGKSFCTGADLEYMKSIAGYSREENLRDARALFEMFETIFECPVPVLGKLHGHVMGGGLGLTACCDIVAAESGTKFCFSEVKIGIVPAVISPFVLKKVPQHFAREVMMTGEIFGATKAEKMGLVHFVGEGEEVGDFIEGKIDFIQSAGPEAVRSTKRLLTDSSFSNWDRMKDETIELISERRTSPEGQEGIRAFLDKRKPKWKTD